MTSSDRVSPVTPFVPGWDGHTHTEFCPHGSREGTEGYIVAAIAAGFTRYSITEHMPLPPDFVDTSPLRDSGMEHRDTEAYLEQAWDLKRRYAGKIDVRVGFEVDFLPEHHAWTRSFLDRYADRLEDLVVSVHFLHGAIVDFSTELFRDTVVPLYGSVAATHRGYFETLRQAVQAEWGQVRPSRLGHMLLCRKFVLDLPLESPVDYLELSLPLLDALEYRGMGLDFNVAGVKKVACGEVYVPDSVVERIVAERRDIPVVYGSDTHSVKGVGQLYERYEALVARFGGFGAGQGQER